ncbi:MAG: hypothetical protein QNK23_02835 [Crocinitomicaceae bacterium]|nr:hypothetical protein [Crocinitomicaceae bacterium]
MSQSALWTNFDKRLIKNIVKIDKENPIEFEQFFIKKNCVMDTVNLGFGWKTWSPQIGGGYISLRGQFYYYNDSIVSYKISPELPSENELVNKYKHWYGDYFSYSENVILPLKSELEILSQPLTEYDGLIITDSLRPIFQEYMHPGSGSIYGVRGGYKNELLYNRKLFLSFSDSLENEELLLMMYSINPVSRFTAIEYYWRNIKQFPQSDIIDAWIESCFLEVPKIKSMKGSVIRSEDSKSLVLGYSQTKNL